MSNYLHSRIREISDAHFQQMLAELCHCVRWDVADHAGNTVFQLLSLLFLEHPDDLTLDHLPTPGLLGTKVKKLKAAAVREFCDELIRLKHTHLEAFDKKPLLALVTDCFPRLGPPPAREMSDYERQTRLIVQRRRNGDL